MNDVLHQRPENKTFVEEVPLDSKGSTGLVERAVQEMEGRIRALFLSLTLRLGRELDAKERIVAFIPEYAAYLYNRMIVGEDGKTAYERMKGKTQTLLGLEFGEKVFYLIQKGDKMRKIKPKYCQNGSHTE